MQISTSSKSNESNAKHEALSRLFKLENCEAGPDNCPVLVPLSLSASLEGKKRPIKRNKYLLALEQHHYIFECKKYKIVCHSDSALTNKYIAKLIHRSGVFNT